MKWTVSDTACGFDERHLYFKKMNEIRSKRIYADNRLKRFKIKNVKNLSTKQTEIHKMLNIASKDSIDAMKKSNIIYKNVWIDNEVWNKAVWNTTKSSNASSHIFENDVTDDNLLNSKTSDIHARVKFNSCRSNRLTEIENLLNSVERNTNTAAFATIDEISIEKKWNAMKIEKFEVYTNDYNSENSLIASLIFRNRFFAISIFSKQSTLSMNYAKKKNDDAVTIIENTNFDTSAVVPDLSISQTFDIFFSSASFFFYINHTKL